MFENATYFDLDDDDVLSTSFTPASSSTQKSSTEKRKSEELDQDNSKKLKLSTNEQSCFGKPLNSSSENEKVSNISLNSPSRIVKRKFPGPAGLLPERKEGNKSIIELSSEKLQDTDDNRNQTILCSQQTVSVFEGGPWKEMTRDFCAYDGRCLYQKFNINWIKKEASSKKLLVNHKAPFLAAIIQSLEISDGKIPTVNITLKDSTGEIQGTILHSLYEEYCDFFTVGSVIVLKQFGVLSSGYDNHCLTITCNNLLTIYCFQAPPKLPHDNTDNFNCGLVKKVVVQEYSVDEILSKYTKYKEDVRANSVQRRKSNEFGQSNQSFIRNNSNPKSTNNSTLSRTNNNNSQRNSLDILKFNNNFNRTSSEDNTIRLNSDMKSDTVLLNNNTSTKFIFKQSSSSQEPKTDGNISVGCAKNTVIEVRENKSCDSIELSCSQISVKPDTKEHAEIWKNLLQDVDADSLFDDF